MEIVFSCRQQDVMRTSSKNYRFDIGGYYWSSSELFWHELTGTFLHEFNEEYVDGDNTYRRHCGYSIRPVTDK